MSRSISIDVGLDEFSADDLVNELVARKSSLTDKHQDALMKIINRTSDWYTTAYDNSIMIRGKVAYYMGNLSDVMAVEEFVKKQKQL